MNIGQNKMVEVQSQVTFVLNDKDKQVIVSCEKDMIRRLFIQVVQVFIFTDKPYGKMLRAAIKAFLLAKGNDLLKQASGFDSVPKPAKQDDYIMWYVERFSALATESSSIKGFVLNASITEKGATTYVDAQ